MENNYTYLKLIQSQNLTFWDVKSYNQQDIASQYKVEKLQNLLIEHTKKVKLFEKPEDDFKILGVNNQEGLFDAYIEKGKNINQPYKKVENGYFAYNPYRINVGSIGLKSDKQKYDYISPAYVVFSCQENLYPQYLEILLKTSYFAQAIHHNTTGSVRQTLGFDNLCNISIPLPSVEKQKELVSEYEHLQNLATQKEEDAKKIENSIDEYLLSELGVKNVSSLRNERNLFKIIQYNALNKWEIDRIYQLEAKYPIVSFGNNPNIVQSIKRGKSPHYSEQSNCLAINQKCVRKQYIDMTYARKIEQIWCDEIDTEYKTKEDDILINSTGEGTIGRAAIVNKETNYIYDSHILNVRLNKEECFPHYFLRLFNTELLQKQVDLYKSGTSTKQTELGVDNLKKISFPLPSMEIQRSIIMEIENKEKQIIILRNESEQLKQQAVSNFEQEVFN